MQKRIASLVTLFVAAVVVLTFGTALAQPPVQNGSGQFSEIQVDVKQVVDFGNMMIVKQTMTSTATGTLDGPAKGDFVCVVTTSTQKGVCSGSIVFKGQAAGALGMLNMNVVLNVEGTTINNGHFAVVSGTAGLTCFEGHGRIKGSFEKGGDYRMQYQSGPCIE